MALLQTGTFYFGTISLEMDYDPSKEMLEHLQKKFKQYLVVTIERGNLNGKLHCHWVGLSTVRTDNLKSSIKKLLSQEGYSVSQHSLDLAPEPNPRWRTGYCLKDLNLDGKDIPSEVRSTTAPIDVLRACLAEYLAKPKRERPEKSAKTMSKKAIAEFCMEHYCQTRDDVARCLQTLKNTGQIDFPTYEKLNVKKLYEYVTDNFNFM